MTDTPLLRTTNLQPVLQSLNYLITAPAPLIFLISVRLKLQPFFYIIKTGLKTKSNDKRIFSHC